MELNTIIEGAIDKEDFYQEYFPEIVFDSTGQATPNVACPFHSDDKPSLSINKDKGGICFGCQAKFSGPIGFFHLWLKRNGKNHSFKQAAKKLYSRHVRPIVPGGEPRVAEWNDILLKDPHHLKHLAERCIPVEAVKKFQIGWDKAEERYTLPITSEEGWITDIRKIRSGPYEGKLPKNMPYDWQTAKDKKERGERTFGQGGRVFPYKNVDKQKIILCEGEFDCIVLCINGFNAVTTGGVSGWKKHYSMLTNKDVTICMDNDEAGRKAASTLMRELYEVCSSVANIELPDGMDVTDYFKAGGTKEQFRGLLKDVKPEEKPDLPAVENFEAVTLNTLEDIHRADNYGKRGIINARLIAEKDQRYSIPLRYEVTCPADRGKPCRSCPMLERGGLWQVELEPGSPQFLDAIGTPDKTILGDFRQLTGISQSCRKLTMETAEVLSVRQGKIAPPIKRKSTNRDKNHQEIISICGDLELNSDYSLEGMITKDPKTQSTLFVVDKANQLETSFQDFNPPEKERVAELRQKFTPTEKGVKAILAKHAEINEILAHNVTFIYGREELHTAIDLTFHSPLQINFEGKLVNSYMETVILGDTNTGKNAVLDTLCDYYKAGLVVDSASTTRAGLLGAFDEKGYFGWGVYVQQHGKMIGLDEGTNLSETMKTLRSIREGKADYFKAGGSLQTVCMARSIVLANDPSGYLSTNAYPVLALPSLFEQEADISRFSLAYFLRGEDTPMDIVNKAKPPQVATDIKREDFQALVTVAWSLRHNDVKFTKTAVEEIYKQATAMTAKYCAKVPLVQASVQRNKVAEWAAALACRQFNFDSKTNKMVVTSDYVKAAVQIVESHYDSEACQYDIYSEQEKKKEEIEDEKQVYDILFAPEKESIGSLATCLRNLLSVKLIDEGYLSDIFMSLETPVSTRKAIKVLVMNRCIEKSGREYTKAKPFVKFMKALLAKEEGKKNERNA